MAKCDIIYSILKTKTELSRPVLSIERAKYLTFLVKGLQLESDISYIIDLSDLTIVQVEVADVSNLLLGVSKKGKKPLSDMLEKIPQEDLARMSSYAVAVDKKMSYAMTEKTALMNFIFNHQILCEGHLLSVDQRLVPLACFPNGFPCLLFCVIRASPMPDVPYLVCRNVENKMLEVYMPEVGSWQALRKRDVTMQEKMIMRLSMQGLSIKQIAERMYLSEAAIKKIRNQLFKKLQVQSITHAVAMVRDLNL